jgi:hypothetical protein
MGEGEDKQHGGALGSPTQHRRCKEIAIFRAKGGARFELCVTVTYKCWARVEPAQKPDNATATMETVARTCRDKGCAEFRVG